MWHDMDTLQLRDVNTYVLQRLQQAGSVKENHSKHTSEIVLFFTLLSSLSLLSLSPLSLSSLSLLYSTEHDKDNDNDYC